MNNPTPLIKKGWLRAVLFILVFFAGAVSIGERQFAAGEVADIDDP